MICCCEKCRFVFESVVMLEQCPDCGHGSVRAATKWEKEEYAANRALYGPMQVYGPKQLVVKPARAYSLYAKRAAASSW